MISFLKTLSGVRRFHALAPSQRALAFYAEDASSFVHFEGLLEELTGPLGREVAYLTSSASDPILTAGNPRVHAFHIGAGVARTWMFVNLRAGVLVMTMPDLERYYLKRSAAHPVHYVYLFHSMVSTHMIYRPGAFDHYDTIFGVGPHHLAEIRATEERYGLAKKRYVEYGYGRLDAILARPEAERPARDDAAPRVLVAPSWGPNGILETCGERVVAALLDAGHEVVVRPHPRTVALSPDAVRRLERTYGDRERFALDLDIRPFDTLDRADAMISDYSGVALEYAFGWERPVLFLDLPPKVNNPAWREIPLEPIEVALRAELGRVVPADEIERLPEHVEALCAEPRAHAARLRALRARVVHNVGTSRAAGARELAALADAALGGLR